MTLNDLSFKYIRQEKEEGDYIFVTFSSWSDKMPSYFGESFLCSQNIESFLICQNTLNDWWHTEDIYKIAEMISERKLASKKKIILYGSSMGGYGALHLRNIFDADIAISIAPQVFIDRLVSSYETRWKLDIDRINEKLIFNEIENLNEQNGMGYLFYDPYHYLDNCHVESYKRLVKNNTIQLVEVPYSNHDLARFLNQIGVLKELVLKVNNEGDLPKDFLSKFSELYLDDYKAFFNFFRKIPVSQDNQYLIYLEKMEKHLLNLEKMDFEALYMAAEALSNLGRFSEAIKLSNRSILSYKERFLKEPPGYLYNKHEQILIRSRKV